MGDMLKGDGSPLVSQMPYVNEFNEKWGYQADDVPWPQDKQKERLTSMLGSKAMRHLDYSFLEGFTDKQQTGHDWEAFKEQVLGPRILPAVLKRELRSSGGNKKATNGKPFARDEWNQIALTVAGAKGKIHPVMNIGMASHSGVIQEICKFTSRSTSNNAVVEVLLMIEAHGNGTEVIVRQESDECATVMNAPQQPKTLFAQDVANCV